MIITGSIIAVTVLISVLGFYNQEAFTRCRFNAYDVRHANQWYRFFTYGFFHAGWFHLAVNMIVLYSFGLVVEKGFLYYFHSKYILYYLLLYVGALLLSMLPAYGKHRNDVFYNAVGASGAVAAIVFASILLQPTQKIYLFFIPYGIPAPVFGVIYLAYEFYMSKRGKDNIGHDAHFWGALFGIIYTIAIKPVIFTFFLQQLGWM
jgi:membrane associated rhomboid family serine protease